MSLAPIPTDPRLTGRSGEVMPWWQSWFESVRYWLNPLGMSGATAARPVDSSRTPLYIGQPYFDTTINKPIWVKSKGPTVWVDATGASV